MVQHCWYELHLLHSILSVEINTFFLYLGYVYTVNKGVLVAWVGIPGLAFIQLASMRQQ